MKGEKTMRKEEEKYIYLNCPDTPSLDKRLIGIMRMWYEFGYAVGDVGGCVVGQGMHFTFEGQAYDMRPITGWQGEGSWTPFVEVIEAMLEGIGATDIRWDCGRLD